LVKRKREQRRARRNGQSYGAEKDVFSQCLEPEKRKKGGPKREKDSENLLFSIVLLKKVFRSQGKSALNRLTPKRGDWRGERSRTISGGSSEKM